MTAKNYLGDRHVIPRWRSVRRTIEAGEFQQLPTARVLTPTLTVELEEYAARWRLERSPSAAAELIGAHLVAGEPLVTDFDAANLLSVHSNPVLRGLVKPSGRSEQADTKPAMHHLTALGPVFHREIANGKATLREDPRHALAWAGLARHYTALGHLVKAERALQIARALAPTSRYLLRVAARFHVHTGNPDKAVALLSGSSRTLDDPWLMAALLSASAEAGGPIKNVKQARRLIQNDNFRMIERSELRSELATVELFSGADRKARALFRDTLEAPTDNALAQAEWASHRLPTFDVSLEGVEVPFPAEAFARAAAEDGDWAAALDHTYAWLLDQPFDSHAAALGSYVAAVGHENWSLSASIAQMGHRARPDDVTLLNNLAYAKIELGEVDAAGQLLDQARRLAGKDDLAVLLATSGLLAFRRSDPTYGRRLYGEAIALARRTGDRHGEVMAKTMLLREEIALASPENLAKLVDALAELRDETYPGVLAYVTRLEGTVAKT